MALTTRAKIYINQLLQHVNLHLDTLTAEKVEMRRLEALEQAGQFDNYAFPILPSFESSVSQEIIEEATRHRTRMDDFADGARNEVGYTYDNAYFSSPDVEVLYAVIRKYQPNKVVEVGCGNSTRVIRQAIIDGHLSTRLISIDPSPRLEISKLADEMILEPVEISGQTSLFESLEANDILFIDSSHEIKTGNDVMFLYLNVMPRLKPGVLIHMHDIFLPYEYPRDWVLGERREFGEQYLVQSLLAYSDMFEVLWPGHFLQRTRQDFLRDFPNSEDRVASSLWLRKVKL